MKNTKSSSVSQAPQPGTSKASNSMATKLSSGRSNTPCCSKVGLKRGPWTPEEDRLLANFIKREGEGRWQTLPKSAGLLRCGKSCRLRWMNYLRPSVKRGHITPDEEDLILRLHRLIGNRWSLIAGRIPGRTDNEIKNYWNTHLSKKLISLGIDPRTHKPLNSEALADPNKASTSKSAGTRNTDFSPIISCPEENLNGWPSEKNENYGNASLLEQYQVGIPAGNIGYTNLRKSDASRMIFKGGTNGEDVSNSSTDDDTFSSFLNSLIKNDMLISEDMQLQ